MTRALRVLVCFLAAIFIMSGIAWYVDPARAAGRLGMPLLDGVGRSSQIGDLSAFFIVMGSCLLVGVITRNRSWFYPGILLLGLAAVGRILAWLLHDAALAADLIGVELFCTVVFLYAARRVTDDPR